MIPLIATMCLCLFSIMSSAFVLLKIVLPILPPSPLSRRVAPSEFGLPNFRSLSPADKSHLWLASFDLFAIALFIWQAIYEYTGGASGFATANDPASAVRIWLALTLRQTCLLIVASITLLHVRMGRSVSFGTKHWLLWAPTCLLVVFSTAVAGVLSGAGVTSLFMGLVAYTSVVAVASSIAFGCLIGTLVIIKRNLAAINDEADPWPPARPMEEKPRPSFATEEIDAIRDGASWITSNASSHRGSVSQWSFSTHQTAINSSHYGHGHSRSRSRSHTRPNPFTGSHQSIPAKSSFWFSAPTSANDVDVPPVPALPSPYGVGPLSPTAENLSDPDPFRRDAPSPMPEEHQQRLRMGSQTSWLTSSNGTHQTLSAWSYPTAHQSESRHGSALDLNANLLPTSGTAVSRPTTPAMANAQVLGGYGFAPGSVQAEKGLAALAAPPGTEIDISIYRGIGWLLTIWIPLVFALPYLIVVSPNHATSPVFFMLLVLSLTLSSPILALNILFRSPIPIPSGLFDVRAPPSANVVRSPSPVGSLPPALHFSHEYKRSGSVTIVEGRRSGDVWIANGDAVDNNNKISRALGMLQPKPKLSVLPIEEIDDALLTPPLPMQMEGDSSIPVTIHNTRSETSAEMGRIRHDSKASSHYSGADESLGFATHIMIAQRHYSTLAQTVLVAASPPSKRASQITAAATTGVDHKRTSNHLRARSVSSISGPPTPTGDRTTFNISPPPAFPLPPTPPSVRAARLRLSHKKSFSSGFSFGPVDDMNQIDALTAGVLPLLVPGLKLGDGMQVNEGDLKDWSPPTSYSRATGKAAKGHDKGSVASRKMQQFGVFNKDDGFSSPEVTSTPAASANKKRTRKTSHRNHFSLPGLGLGKNGVHSLSPEIGRAVEYAPVVDMDARRNTVWGAESVPNTLAHLQAVNEDDELLRPASPAFPLERSRSTRSLGLRVEVPHGVDTARSSIASFNMLPGSAASTATLFELDDGPQAESTPHNSTLVKPTTRHAPPPLPLPNHVTESSRPTRRSSIVYIKSENDPTTLKTVPSSSSVATASTPVAPSAMTSFARWSSRAVRPLIPKSGTKPQRKISNATSSPPPPKSGSPRGGLRPLSLLQERDVNNLNNNNTSTAGADRSADSDSIRPLTLGKKQHKSRLAAAVVDENARPGSSQLRSKQSGASLKPLQLARSETSKMRGVLRREQALPDVVVRPPSSTQHTSFAYSFNAE